MFFQETQNIFSIQSKIAEKSLSSHKVNGEAIITGNLIFSDIDKEKLKKRIYSLCSYHERFYKLSVFWCRNVL